jgi:hypothetical protein
LFISLIVWHDLQPSYDQPKLTFFWFTNSRSIKGYIVFVCIYTLRSRFPRLMLLRLPASDGALRHSILAFSSDTLFFYFRLGKNQNTDYRPWGLGRDDV